MVLKIGIIVVLVFVLAIAVLVFIIKRKDKKIDSLKSENQTYKNAYEELTDTLEKLNKELEIERRHKNELAKKLADISTLSIDDVLHQLQNGKSS